MKYPSVFLALFCIWLAILVISQIYQSTQLALNLYRLTVVFSLVLFLIGFWKNK